MFYSNSKQKDAIKRLPFCALRKAMVDLSTDVLSILRFVVETMRQSSLINILNWSRRRFSLKFRDFLKVEEYSQLSIECS